MPRARRDAVPPRVTGRAAADPAADAPPVPDRAASGWRRATRHARGAVDRLLRRRTATIADLSVFAYTHVAGDAGVRARGATPPSADVARAAYARCPGFVDDLAAVPGENARRRQGRDRSPTRRL